MIFYIDKALHQSTENHAKTVPIHFLIENFQKTAINEIKKCYNAL